MGIETETGMKKAEIAVAIIANGKTVNRDTLLALIKDTAQAIGEAYDNCEQKPDAR